MNKLSQQAQAFADACYDQNSMSELDECLSQTTADATDCAKWGISSDEWFAAIKQARETRLADAAA